MVTIDSFELTLLLMTLMLIGFLMGYLFGRARSLILSEKAVEPRSLQHRFIPWEVKEDPVCGLCGKCASEVTDLDEECTGMWPEERHRDRPIDFYY